MSNNHRFKLSHLMPNSWFYKLRDMKRPKPTSQTNTTIQRASTRPQSHHYYHGTTTPKPLPISPPHKSYSYTQTNQRSLEKLHQNPKAIDIHFPKDHHHSPMSRNAIADDEFQDLRLRPIRTRPTSTGLENVHGMIMSGTCPSSPRLRSRRLHKLNGCRVSTTTATSSSHRRSGARASFAVVKASTDPWKDFRESMVEMIVENEMRAPEDLEDLLECYLSLNSKEYHGVIMKVFHEICRLELADANVEELSCN